MELVLGMDVAFSRDDFVFDGDPAAPQQKVHAALPTFRAMFIAAKRMAEDSRFRPKPK